MFPRAGGCFHLTMSQNALGGNRELTPQFINKRFQCLQLSRGRRRLLEVSNEADAHAVCIEQRFSSMSAGQLLLPAERRFDCSVRQSVPIADQEVITDPQPGVPVGIQTLAMLGMNRCDIARHRGRVVQDDELPLPRSRVRCNQLLCGNWLSREDRYRPCGERQSQRARPPDIAKQASPSQQVRSDRQAGENGHGQNSIKSRADRANLWPRFE